MGDWIGHGATPNNWRSLGTDVDSGQKSSVSSGMQRVHWALALVCPRERCHGFGKMLFAGVMGGRKKITISVIY